MSGRRAASVCARSRLDVRTPAALRGTLLGAALLAIGLAGAACERGDGRPRPPEGRERAGPAADGVAVTSRSGAYRVSLRPRDGEAPLGRMHAWVVRVETADGEPFAPSRLTFDGGMPQHDHGFPTAPRVTQALGPGEYLVEGVRYHMGGEWTLRVEVVGPAGPDVAVARVRVGP